MLGGFLLSYVCLRVFGDAVFVYCVCALFVNVLGGVPWFGWFSIVCVCV